MDFKTHLKKYLSDTEIDKLISSFDQPEKKGLFVNTEKMSYKQLEEIFPNLKPHPIITRGFIYDKDEIQPGKKVYHESGAYYISEPSAMLVSFLLNPSRYDVVLDLCAAPGGKTVQAALRMEDEGMIIANDLSTSRANILLSNIERMGITNTIITSLDFSKHSNKFKNYFDKIILDAPCSGSGMFRKSDEMKNDWTYEKVLKNAAIQKDLILMAYSMLKEGGTMAYSTCSYSFEEDEEVIEYLLNNTDAELVNICDQPGYFRSPKYKETIHLFPSHFEGEGHYIALIHKPGLHKISCTDLSVYLKHGTTKGGVKTTEFYDINGHLPKDFEKLCLRPGFFKCTYINGDYIPSHHMSHYAKTCQIEVSKENLAKYLRGESLILDKKYPDDYYVISYLGMGYGYVHSVNGVLKNLYPKGLRINVDIETGF